MNLKVDIKNVYLGKATAENERDELHKYFLTTRAYLNAKDERKRKLFYIGHRGAGKTALFNQLTYEYSEKINNIIIQISPTEYSFDTFRKIQHDFVDVRAAYSIAWHYTLLIQILIEVSNYFHNHRHLKKNRDNLSLIDKYLHENGFRDADTRLEIFFEFLSRINISKLKLKFKFFEIEGKNGENPSKELLNILNMKDIKRPLMALEDILRTHCVYIFIDELDTGWNNTEEAKNFINGLIYAAQKVNNMNNVAVFLSLRQDMYNNLSETYKDTEKIRDEIEFLKWEKSLLKSLICYRIYENKEIESKIGHIKDFGDDKILNLIFDDAVFEYILERTLLRPREVIHFCNKAIEQFSENFIRRKIYDGKVDMETVRSIEEQISLDRFNDYCAEYNDEFPNIKILLNSFEGSTGIFNKNDFIKMLDIALNNFVEETNDIEVIKNYLDNSDKLMIKLFEIGFIKLSVSNEVEFFAFYEKRPLTYKNVLWIQINTIFRTALKCLK